VLLGEVTSSLSGRRRPPGRLGVGAKPLAFIDKSLLTHLPLALEENGTTYSRRCRNIGNSSRTLATASSEMSTPRTPGSSPRSASMTPMGSTRMLRPTETGGAWHAPATYTLFSMARAAFSASHCSVLWVPGTQDADQQHLGAGVGQ
jgi:hypothetical protein